MAEARPQRRQRAVAGVAPDGGVVVDRGLKVRLDPAAGLTLIAADLLERHLVLALHAQRRDRTVAEGIASYGLSIPHTTGQRDSDC